MKAAGLILFAILLIPIYVLPWVMFIGTLAGDPETYAPAVNESAAIAEFTESVETTAGAVILVKAVCYSLLFLIALVFAKGARWVSALVGLAAVFDTLLMFIPFVPTVLLVVAFVFMAKARPPQLPDRVGDPPAPATGSAT